MGNKRAQAPAEAGAETSGFFWWTGEGYSAP